MSGKNRRCPTLTIGDELTAEDVRIAWDFLDRNQDRDVEIVFDSNGGICRAGIELNRAFREHGRCLARVYRAESASAIAMLGCKWRIGEPLCSIMIHNPYLPDGTWNAGVEELRLLCSAMVARDTGQDIRQVMNWMDGEGHEMVGSAARNAGFLHSINQQAGSSNVDDRTLLKIRCIRQQASRLGGLNYRSLGPRAAGILRSATRRFGKDRHVR